MRIVTVFLLFNAPQAKKLAISKPKNFHFQISKPKKIGLNLKNAGRSPYHICFEIWKSEGGNFRFRNKKQIKGKL